MAKKLMELNEEFSQKMELIENARKVLKTEYAGIDNVIDQVVDNVRSWFTMSLVQDRPSVLNLWGLTGVGKTSLVLRLMELLEYDDRTFRLDLGEKEGKKSFKSTLDDLCDNKDDSPVVILLDEFQHSRTIRGPLREEVENDQNRLVWELIDSGKVSYVDWKRGMWHINELASTLRKMLRLGVEVENGLVVKGQSIYTEELCLKPKKNEKLHFLPRMDYDTIIDLVGHELRIDLRSELEEIVMTMNGQETIEFLFKVYRLAQRPSVKNFSKALIVILGNLDEAYTMSGNYTSEISADEFYQQSLKITIPSIKSALRSRFRNEQIARLGNNHIIYPALSSEAYYRIIDLELNRINSKMQEQFGIEIIADQTVKDILYKEGVYPTQGARPLITTIHQMIKSRISVFLNELLLRSHTAVNTLQLSYADEKLICEFFENEKFIGSFADPVKLNLENLRRSKNDELQTITAVHESGHAVLTVTLLNKVPELIVSVSPEADNSGFVYAKNERKYISKKEIVHKAAVQLGGIIAEELIFGEDNVTAGASTDILHATGFVTNMLKQHGMGKELIRYANTEVENLSVYHNSAPVEEEVKEILRKARSLATQTLNENRQLLLTLAEHLTKHSKIEKAELEELMKDRGFTHSKTIEESLYRDILKAQLTTNKVFQQLNENNPIIMNKNRA